MLINVNGRQMKTISFDAITAKVEADEVGKQDLVVAAGDLHMTDHGTVRISGDGAPREYRLNQWSYSQLCNKLGIPSTYLRKCQLAGIASQQDQVNFWISEIADKRLLIRVKNDATVRDGIYGHIRAVLTSRYSALDNKPLWDSLSTTLKHRGVVVQQAFLTEKSFHIRAVYPDGFSVPTTTDKQGLHYLGLSITNSEIGARILEGDMMLFRQICTNGLIAKVDGNSLFAQKHMGIHNPDDFQQVVRQSLDATTEYGETLRARLEAARTVKVESPKAELERFLLANKETKEFVEKAQAQYDAEPMPTRFGIVQAITAAARTLQIDRRHDVESLAGNLLLN